MDKKSLKGNNFLNLFGTYKILHNVCLLYTTGMLLCLKEAEGEIAVSGSRVVSKERFIKIIFNKQTYLRVEILEFFCIS